MRYKSISNKGISSTFATVLLIVLVLLFFSVGYITFSTIFDNNSSQKDFTTVTFSQDGEYLNIMPKSFEEPVEVKVNGTKIGELNSPFDNLRYKIEQENLDKTQIQIYDKSQNQLTQKISANKLFQKSDLTQNITITIKSETKKEYTIQAESQAYYEQDLLYEKEWGDVAIGVDQDHPTYRVLHEFKNDGEGEFKYLFNVYGSQGGYGGDGGFYIGKDGKKEISCSKYDDSLEGTTYYNRLSHTPFNNDCYEYRGDRYPDSSSSYVDTFIAESYESDASSPTAGSFSWGKQTFNYEEGDQLVAYVHGGDATHGYPNLYAERNGSFPLQDQNDWDRFNQRRLYNQCPISLPTEEFNECENNFNRLERSDLPSGLKLYGAGRAHNSTNVEVEVAGQTEDIGTMTPTDNIHSFSIETTRNIDNSDISVSSFGEPVTTSIQSESVMESSNVQIEIPKIGYINNIGTMTVNNKKENITIQTNKSITKSDIYINHSGQEVVVRNIQIE